MKEILGDDYEFNVMSPKIDGKGKNKNRNKKRKNHNVETDGHVTREQFETFLKEDVVTEWKKNKDLI